MGIQSWLKPLIPSSVYTYSRLRTLNYATQFAFFRFLSDKILYPQETKLQLDAETLKKLEVMILDFLKKDSDLFGLYPQLLPVLKPDTGKVHYGRIPWLLLDGIRMTSRRKRKKTKEFSLDTEILKSFPDYYTRNFHFQTDGYLSSKSADLYDHQVEMLFSGTADAMRRLLIPSLVEHFETHLKTQGAGLRFLEIGCGTGRSTLMVHTLFPRAEIIALDLSPFYIKYAQKQFIDKITVQCIQGDGANLLYQDQTFDAVFSVFLLHELPLDVRKKVLSEAKRVLKKGGCLELVDSLQKGDEPLFDPLLENFPIYYHEPFYKNYVSHPLKNLLKQIGFVKQKQSTGFASQVIHAEKKSS